MKGDLAVAPRLLTICIALSKRPRNIYWCSAPGSSAERLGRYLSLSQKGPFVTIYYCCCSFSYYSSFSFVFYFLLFLLLLVLVFVVDVVAAVGMLQYAMSTQRTAWRGHAKEQHVTTKASNQ